MAHISYSEMKDWAFCAFYHKLTRIDKVQGFKGNAFTAFGTAVHTICERKLLKKKANEETFVQEFEKCLERLDDDVQVDQKLVDDMRQQGQLIVPEIEEALSDYFKDFEVVAINDLVPSDNLAYLLKYDSTQGRFDGTVEAPTPDSLVVAVDHAKGFDWKIHTTKDKVHPNAQGAEKMASKWFEALENLPQFKKGSDRTAVKKIN